MGENKANIEEVRIWNTIVTEYLHIAHNALTSLPLNEQAMIDREIRAGVFTCCVFSFLAVDGMFNYRWLLQYESRSRGEGNPATSQHWHRINSERKWIDMTPPEKRIDQLALSVSGIPFFETSPPKPCRDLFRDYTNLRNALVLSVPDQTYMKLQFLEAGPYGVRQFDTLVHEAQWPKGRRPPDRKLSCRLSSWVSLTNLRPQHALEVFKISLAIFHHADSILGRPLLWGLYLLHPRLFKDIYRQLPPCHFDQALRQGWDL